MKMGIALDDNLLEGVVGGAGMTISSAAAYIELNWSGFISEGVVPVTSLQTLLTAAKSGNSVTYNSQLATLLTTYDSKLLKGML